MIMILIISSPARAQTKQYHEIQWGDTLSQISMHYNELMVNLIKLNQIDNPNLIYAGDFLKLPNNNSKIEIGYNIEKLDHTLNEKNNFKKNELRNIVKINPFS